MRTINIILYVSAYYLRNLSMLKILLINHLYRFLQTLFLYFYSWHYQRCPHLPPFVRLHQPAPPSLWPSPRCCLCLRVVRVCFFANPFSSVFFFFLISWLLERDRKGETERNVDLLFHLWIYSLVDSRVCPDQGLHHKRGLWGRSSDQLSRPAGALIQFRYKLPIHTMSVTSNIF